MMDRSKYFQDKAWHSAAFDSSTAIYYRANTAWPKFMVLVGLLPLSIGVTQSDIATFIMALGWMIAMVWWTKTMQQKAGLPLLARSGENLVGLEISAAIVASEVSYYEWWTPTYTISLQRDDLQVTSFDLNQSKTESGNKFTEQTLHQALHDLGVKRIEKPRSSEIFIQSISQSTNKRQNTKPI